MKVEFKDTEQGRVLVIAGRNKRIESEYENYPDPVSTEQLKSLIVGRHGNEKFFKNLSKNAMTNLMNPRGENALTWNVFQSLFLLDRWDIFFDSIDIISGQTLLNHTPGNKKPTIYFWNIMPGAGYFNYHHARLLYQEGLCFSNFWGMYFCEPDCVVFFDNLILLIEAKLKSPFETCRKKETDKCKGYQSCYLYQHFMTHFKKMGYTYGAKPLEECHLDNQLYRNLRIGQLFSMLKSSAPCVMVNVLNEHSTNFVKQREQCLKFTRRLMDPSLSMEFTDYYINTASWQSIRRSIEEKNDGKSRDLAVLHKYLARHPDLQQL